MDIDKIYEIMSGPAGSTWETTKKPLDLETVIKIYEKESRKIRYKSNDISVFLSNFADRNSHHGEIII